MARGGDFLTFMKYIDVVPVDKTIGNLFVRLKVSIFKIIHSLIRKYYPKPPRHIVGILLIDIYLPLRISFFC